MKHAHASRFFQTSIMATAQIPVAKPVAKTSRVAIGLLPLPFAPHWASRLVLGRVTLIEHIFQEVFSAKDDAPMASAILARLLLPILLHLGTPPPIKDHNFLPFAVASTNRAEWTLLSLTPSKNSGKEYQPACPWESSLVLRRFHFASFFKTGAGDVEDADDWTQTI